MRNILVSASLAMAGFLVSAQPSRFVDPFIGTDGMGHTFPGACVPFGGIQLSPDTDIVPHNIAGKYQQRTYDYCAGYRHSDSTIVGFSHRHLSGTGHSDLGDILIMPTTGPVQLTPGTADHPEDGYRSRFSHDTEVARPGLYEVTLADYGIRARLSATKRVGVHEYTYPSYQKQNIILDLTHSIYGYDGKVCRATLRVENDTLVTGFRLTDGWARTNYTYFAISFSKPIRDYGYEDKKPSAYSGFWRRFDIGHNFPDMAGRDVAAWFSFDEGEPLTVKVAISAVDAAGAIRNLEAEAAGSFDEIASMAAQEWDKALGRFEVEGTDSEKTMFYTSVYHTLINPSVYMDVDGKYRGVDGNIHQAEGFTNYTVFSLWDTYRAEHPFLGLLWPEENSDMIKSMVEHWKQNAVGMLPVWSLMGNENWCMSGYHAVPVLADAIVKGTYKGSAEEALAAMTATSKVRIYEGLGFYMDHGFVPLDESGTAASTTLEYSYDDWTIYAAALKAGASEIADEYGRRAMNYANVYDPSIGYARPRYSDGSFKKDFDIDQTYGEGFIEGNSRNFSFHVPQDVKGVMELMGGEKAFLGKLENLFAMDLDPKYYEDNEDIEKECLVGGYVHGNEPSHHVPYLFAWTSKPWLTQYWVREIMNRMYREGIDGLGGNDDCGQMSAWYLFSAMGFYPVCPGTDQYVLGAPYLPYIRITLPDGKKLEIKADGVSNRNRYVKRVKINGKPLDRRYVTHEEILDGGVWEFEMASRPSGAKGLKKPYSMSDNN
ncbi:MAG: GH92 family glycosyl hydrolase [Candidatus Cryptobacteroides sp.]|nr:GH92 family glycosyl hydrolase [Candidatus Cryptobacteroides sp.]